MKIKYLFPLLAASALIGLAPGCGKKQPPPPPMTEEEKKAAEQADAAIFQRALERAKSLVDQQNWPDAIAQFKAFDDMKLSAEQKAQVDALKAKVPSTAKK